MVPMAPAGVIPEQGVALLGVAPKTKKNRRRDSRISSPLSLGLTQNNQIDYYRWEIIEVWNYYWENLFSVVLYSWLLSKLRQSWHQLYHPVVLWMSWEETSVIPCHELCFFISLCVSKYLFSFLVLLPGLCSRPIWKNLAFGLVEGNEYSSFR